MTPASVRSPLLALLALAAACGDDVVVDPGTTSAAASTSSTTADATTTAAPSTTAPTTTDGGATDSASGTTGGTTTAVDPSTTTTVDPSTSTTADTTTTDTTTTADTTGCVGPDEDGDTVPDACDVCPAGDDLVDADADTVPDACDICADGDDLVDADADAVPDACDPCPADNPDDDDADGVCNSKDVCPDGPDDVDVDDDGLPDACDPDVTVEVMGPLYDFDSADDGTLLLTDHSNGAVFLTCYNPDLTVRKAKFQVGSYDLEPAPPPGPTVDIARTGDHAIVVWQDPSGVNTLSRMKYTYLDGDCNVLVMEAVAMQNASVDYMEYHSTAIDAAGNAVIAASRTATRAAFIASGGALVSEQQAFSINGAYGTHVAMNQTTGEGIVTSQPHSGGTLYYRRFNADATWKDPAAVQVPVNYHAWYDGHTVGMNDKGQFLLLWRSSSTQLDFRIFDSDATVLADVARPTLDYDAGTPYDAFRRRHSEIQLRGDNFVLGETNRSDAPEVLHFEYTPTGELVTEDSTPITVAMVLAIRVTPGGRTYLHDGNLVTLLSNYP